MLKNCPDLLCFSLSDHVSDPGGIGQFFIRQGTSFAIPAGKQSLIEDKHENLGKLQPLLLLFFGVKYLDDPFYGRSGCSGMHGAYYQMPGFRRLYRNCKTFGIPHLTDHDNIRCLTEYPCKTFME